MDKREKAFQLKEELRKLELEIASEEFEEKRKKRDKFESKSRIQVYTSDDYCGLETKRMRFYYGYEETYCPVKSHEEDCEDNGCEKREWCFVVTKKGKEAMRIPKSKLHPVTDEEPFWYLVAGIGQYLNRISTKE